MTKKHDELVEEIAVILQGLFIEGVKRDVPEQTSWDIAQDLITLILSAIRDGRLNEELGVVGRKKYGVWHEFRAWLAEMHVKHNAEVFIALSGTGKEE